MTRCVLCPRVRPPVPSTGPVPATVLLLGEAGHRTEDIQGLPFVGDTGKELDNVYLPLSGIPRSEYHIYNARCCSNKDYANPTPEEARSCAETHLGELLSKVKPKIIMPMGAVACSLFPGINLNTHHGIPRPGSWGPWSGIVFPTYHPTAGMRKTAYMIPLMNDFAALKTLVAEVEAGTFEYPSDPYPEPDYRIIKSPNDLVEYFEVGRGGPGDIEWLACDTESYPDGSPFCLTFSHTPGTGRLIYVKYRDLMNEFEAIHTCCGLATPNEYFKLLFHNYLHDVVPFDELDIPIGKFVDTMVYAYNLCLGGGGDDDDENSGAGRGSLSLKTLAFRHLAMHMTSFKDTVHPFSKPHMVEWLKTAEALLSPPSKINICVCGHPQSEHSQRGKTNRPIGDCGHFITSGEMCGCPRYKLDKAATKLVATAPVPRLKTKVTSLLRDIANPTTKRRGGKKAKEGPVDPWDRYKKWNQEDFDLLEPCLGPPPEPSIAHVSEEALKFYACRDADATLRLFLFLRRYNPWLFRNRR